MGIQCYITVIAKYTNGKERTLVFTGRSSWEFELSQMLRRIDNKILERKRFDSIKFVSISCQIDYDDVRMEPYLFREVIEPSDIDTMTKRFKEILTNQLDKIKELSV